ncbi:MAG: hypothetical protein AAF216_07265 [Pseudomonadota bacterium]
MTGLETGGWNYDYWTDLLDFVVMVILVGSPFTAFVIFPIGWLMWRHQEMRGTVSYGTAWRIGSLGGVLIGTVILGFGLYLVTFGDVTDKLGVFLACTLWGAMMVPVGFFVGISALFAAGQPKV